MNPFGYSEPVWRLFKETPRAGTFSNGTAVSGAASTPAGRGALSLHLKLEGGRIADARFQAYGCPTTIAVGAWLAGQVIGCQMADLDQIRAADIQKTLEIPPERTHCALLGEDVLKAVQAAASSRK
jgi:NifU-like protein involved in Fe-S cluster formation